MSWWDWCLEVVKIIVGVYIAGGCVLVTFYDVLWLI